MTVETLEIMFSVCVGKKSSNVPRPLRTDCNNTVSLWHVSYISCMNVDNGSLVQNLAGSDWMGLIDLE